MAEGSYVIAKAGWLHRQSSVLHRWKKNWFVLDRDGDLRYFDSPESPRAEERIVVRASVIQVKTGPQCRKADPPEGMVTKACFLELCLRDKSSVLVCAESLDDMRAWQISLEEARTLPVHGTAHSGVVSTSTFVSPPGYYNSVYGSYYPGQVIAPAPPQVIHHPGGTTTVVQGQPQQQIVYVDDEPRRNRRYYRGGIYPVPLFFF